MSSTLPPITTTPAAVQHDDGVWRSARRQPLYSSCGLDNAALPQTLDFFTYSLGQNVPGAGNAAGVTSRLFHTNMQTAGVLAKPQKFRCDGVQVIMHPIAFGSANTPGLSDPSFGAAAQDSEMLEDLILFTYASVLQIRVGQKLYANHPLWMFPSNLGFRGMAAVGQDNGTAATAGTLDVCLPSTVGNGVSFRVYPFLIEDSQSFGVSIKCPLASPPSLNDDRLVTVFLHGTYHREVM